MVVKSTSLPSGTVTVPVMCASESDFASIITDATGTTHVTVFQGATLTAGDVAAFAGEIASADVLAIDNEVPEEVKDKLTIIPVADVTDVLEKTGILDGSEAVQE